MRTAELSRTTKETDIYAKIDLDGTGVSEIDTGLPFFDHMLTLFSKHGKFDLTVRVKGDLEVDAHHSMEDTGLVLGKVIADALGDKIGIGDIVSGNGKSTGEHGDRRAEHQFAHAAVGIFCTAAHSTATTLFSVPKSLAMKAGFSSSITQSPLTTNLYS